MFAETRHVVDPCDIEEEFRRIRQLLLIRQENGVEAAAIGEMRFLLLGRGKAQAALFRAFLHLVVETVEAARGIVGVVGAPAREDDEGDRRIDGRDLRMCGEREVALLVAEGVVDTLPRLVPRHRLAQIFKLDGKAVFLFDFFAHLIRRVRLAVFVAAACEEIIYPVNAQDCEEYSRGKADRDRQPRIFRNIHASSPLGHPVALLIIRFLMVQRQYAASLLRERR